MEEGVEIIASLNGNWSTCMKNKEAGQSKDSLSSNKKDADQTKDSLSSNKKDADQTMDSRSTKKKATIKN